jgi:hypothetical protein
VCLAAYETYLYDVILRVAGIETPREGKLDDVIALYVFETLAVLLGIHDEAAVGVRPSVLQWCRKPSEWQSGLLPESGISSLQQPCTLLSMSVSPSSHNAVEFNNQPTVC